MKHSGDLTKDLTGLIEETLSPTGSRFSIRVLIWSLFIPLVLVAIAFLVGHDYIVPDQLEWASLKGEMFRSEVNRNFVVFFSGTFLCLTLFSLASGVWLYRFVIRPLVELRKFAEDMKTSKDLNRRLPEQGAGEIRALTRSFNSLLVHVREMEMELVSTGEIVNSSKYAALGEMAGGIAHEINTPLATIMVNADLIESYLDSDPIPMTEVKFQLERSRQTVEQVAKVIKGLRTFARDGGGLEHQETTAGELIDQALDLCFFRFREAEIHIEHIPPTDQAQLKCNPVQIVQILVNLLNNAHDALNDQDDKQIKIRVDESSSEVVAIEVMDNGPGIQPEVEEKIFNPFFSTKPVGNTGLGLSISMGIAHQHKGVLFHYREDEEWTCFCLQLPRRKCTEGEGQEAA
ncbi:MAG: HAMP domain-containing protein [Bdellovibrionaceae bacterium]|nr:HAMP domain-containing protein [Bdellovibrionales bacterium]MCB9083387.1 HAMP domain-containing protein [Pseudobdellovibrionaceae bacterium]